MASAFLSSILSKASQVLGFAQRSEVSPSSSSDPRSNVLKDLKKLERTLKRIQAVLHDAEEREIRDESVKLWLKELKEVAYEADDVLDEYQYEVLRAQVEGRASGRKRKRVEGDDEEEVSIPDGMGDRIREIRERFDEISQDRERFHLREEDGERRVLEAPYPAPTSHMVDESSIYGRERDKQEIIDLLFAKGVRNGVSVIPIVGKGGLGKTTIAQLVYKDPKVKQYFNLTGWVCVSYDFDVPRLTKAIFESLTGSSYDPAQLSTIQDTLKEKLKGKRVLLVLDDVWNDQQSRWECLKNSFVGAETVTIIVTCRNYSVAEIMQTVRPYHPLCLSPWPSWSLFKHYAFGGRDTEVQPRLADIGEQIVKKCSGLPLAVKSIGSLMRYMADEDSWIDVMQSDIWEVDKNNEILPALRLSYSRMPSRLKPCFSYCSMFPKDYEFDKDELVRLWMAQGYIQTSGGRRRMENIGNEYFNDLQRRSFFDSDSSMFFKMHDMIHDLAKSIAGNECWAIVDKKLPSLPHEVRHLYVGKSLHLYNFSPLRTLLLRDWFGFPTAMLERIKTLLRCLRTLEFCWEREDEIPDLLGNLKHLRYLCIKSKKLEKLSESICLLYHLQTLVLDCQDLAKLPNGLGNLTNLHRLQIVNRIILCLPAGIEKLTNLQSLLGCYKVQGGIGGVLKNLENLQTLIISGLRNVVNIEDARDAGLKHKHKLEELFLHWNAVDCIHVPHHNSLLHLEAFSEENKDVLADEKREEAMLEYLQPQANLKELVIDGYGGSKFPEWVGNLFSSASFRKISIINCESIWSLPLYIHDSLGKLDAPISKSMLERVYISGCWQLTSIAGLHHLHSLKDLTIKDCPQLQLLSEEGLPSNLQDLHIEECQQLTTLPRMQNLTFLRAITIKDCPQLRFLSDEGLSPNLQVLHIKKCQQLASLPGMQNLSSPRRLFIQNCPQLRLLLDRLPSNLEDVHIEECQQLTSLSGLQNLTSLRALTIRNCPQLQFLSEKRLPSKLKCLRIEECQELTSLPGMQNLTSLEKITIKDCPQLRLLLDRLPSNLKDVHIEECQQLTSLLGLQNLTSLGALTIRNCPQLWLLSERLPSKLKCLHIEDCQQLTSLSGMQNLISLRRLIIKNCPKLQIMAEDHLSSMHCTVIIVDCPRLIYWCQIQGIMCIQVASGNKLTLSDTWENIMSGYDLTSVEYLCFSNSWEFFMGRVSKPLLEELTIWGCTVIPPLWYWPKLTFLQRLVIKDCPGLLVLGDYLLPSTLKSLVVDSCGELRDLPLAQENRDAFEELQLVNCPRLQRVQGLNWLFLPKILRIERCPALWLTRVEDQLSSMPYCVEIVDCPRLSYWCQMQRINCIQVVLGNKLTISNTWENIMHGFYDLTSVEHLCFGNSWVGNSWELFLRRDSIPLLEELTIWGCTVIPPLWYLPMLASLRNLVIKDCPGVLVLEDYLFPSTLKSLVVDSCEHLMFLLLAQQNRDAFEELQLVNCPKLIWVEGLNCLFFPKILRIERCPQLQLPQDDQESSNPPHVEIEEDTENKETI